ncbi:hypothetical protein D3C85_1294460 [compost metagenome]
MCNEVEAHTANASSVHRGELLAGFTAAHDGYASIPPFATSDSVQHRAIVAAMAAGLDNHTASEPQVVVQCPQSFKRSVWGGVAAILSIREVSGRAENMAVSIPSTHRK